MKTEQLLNYELSERIKNGDTLAFELLFKMYYQPLIRYSQVFIKNKEERSELVQETFIKIWETRSAIDSGKSLKSYLYRCVHNNCINFLKKKLTNLKHNDEYRRELEISTGIWEEYEPEKYHEWMNDEKKMDAIHQAIDNLPVQCREIFVLCRFENYSYLQIAEKLNISVNTVKTQLQRAMAKLKAVEIKTK